MNMEDKTTNQGITKVLADIVNAVVGKFEMQDLLQQILDTTMNTLHAEVCSIFLKKTDSPNKIICVKGSGFAKAIEGKAEYEITKDSGLTGYVAATGELLNIKSKGELLAHPHRKGKHDTLQFGESEETKCRNLLMLPLKIKGDEILGVIKVENKKEGFGNYFSVDDQRIFEIIANVIALTIKNAKLQEQREEQSRAIRIITNQVVGKLEKQELLDKILKTVMNTLKADVCSIFLKKEGDSSKIECAAGAGYAKSLFENKVQYEIGEGFTGMVAKGDNDGYKIDSYEEMEYFKKIGKIQWDRKWNYIQWEGGEDKFHNLLALPLKIKEETLGVIKVENKKVEYGSCFSEDDFQTFKTIANVIALAIENSKLLKQTEENLNTITLMAAHKINNQVTSYSGIERQLRREGKVDDKLLTRFSNTTRNLKTLIDELNNFAKPTELKKELGCINTVIEEAIVNSSGFPEIINIQCDLDKTIPEFHFDYKLSESILELIRNAQKVISNSGQGNNIIVATKLIHVADKQIIKITIEDDGPGLPENKDVFAPYFSTDPKGTGLGLTTVQKLVQKHGGSITASSKETGSIFEIALPIRRV